MFGWAKLCWRLGGMAPASPLVDNYRIGLPTGWRTPLATGDTPEGLKERTPAPRLRVLTLCALVLILGIVGPGPVARAQSASGLPAPPLFPLTDANGVDLSSGSFVPRATPTSVG